MSRAGRKVKKRFDKKTVKLDDGKVHQLKLKKPIAIVVSQFNTLVTEGLLSGAIETLRHHGVEVKPKHVFEAPGAYEIPLIAQRLARSKRFAGVVCLGCVIKGETAHFEFISLSAAIGLQMASLETEVPMAFGILTTYNEAQASTRAMDNGENKGREAAHAVLGALQTLSQID